MIADWSDGQLREYEERLYDDEISGEDTWALRDEVLWEMNRRGMMDRFAQIPPTMMVSAAKWPLIS